MKVVFITAKTFLNPVFIIIPLLMLLTTTAISDFECYTDVAPPAHENEYSDLCRESPAIEEEKTHGNYKATISRAGDGDCHFIQIKKDGVLLYHNEEIGGHFYFGADLEQKTDPFLQITGASNLNFVFSKWTGGAHCCFSLYIFELSNEFKEIANIDGGNFLPSFEDINHDEIPEIKIWDDFLAYQFSCFADSAIGYVVLKYTGDGYKVAGEYMHRPAPDLNLLVSKIESWQKLLQKRKDLENMPRSFMQTITNLVFTGNKETALELVERTWPSDFPEKEEFLKLYDDALNESKFYQEFERQL